MNNVTIEIEELRQGKLICTKCKKPHIKKYCAAGLILWLSWETLGKLFHESQDIKY